MVIKESAHKCNPYFDPTQISKREVQLARSRFSVSGNQKGKEMLKVRAAVKVQLAACTIASPSYLKLRKLTLIGLMAFLPQIYDTNMIKVGCTCVHILCLP